MEDALIVVPTIRRIAGVALITDWIPDETMNLTFRKLLENYDPGEQIFEAMKVHLKANGMVMNLSSITVATFIASPSSTSMSAKPLCAGCERT
jgi:transposase, IS5 family